MKPDGWTVCREIRKISSVPIIILTKRMDDFDEIYGLELGADDYIKKPANPNILLARIHSLLRRSYHDSDSLIYYKHLTIDNARHSVHIQNQEIVLSPKEYRILLLLVENSGKIVSREELLRKVWGYYYYGGLRTVDTHINRLRIKLEDFGSFIHTIRGFEYRLDDKNDLA